MKKSLIVCLLALTPAFAYAELPSLTKVKADLEEVDAENTACLEQPENQSTPGMKFCMNEAFDKADAKLNEVYQSIVKTFKAHPEDKYDRETLNRLVKAQRAWITFRDTNSLLQSSTAIGGSLESLEYLSSLYGMTKNRAIELAQLFDTGM